MARRLKLSTQASGFFLFLMKNYSKLLSEFKNRTITLESMPAVMYIESVRGCPYSCVMCDSRFTKPHKISQDLLDRVEPYFKNVEVLCIHGQGEPLLGDIPYFVEQSLKHDFVLHMNSTGFFLTKEIADLLTKARLSIRFSIHAGSPQAYKKIMGQKFEKVLENISYLIRKDKENKRNSDFWFSFIVMKENIEGIDDFLKITHDIGVKRIRFMELLPTSESIKGIQLPERNFTFSYFEQNNPSVGKEFLKKLPHYRKIAEDYGLVIEVGSMEASARDPHFFENIVNKASKKFLSRTRIFPLKRRSGICVAPWIGQLIIRFNGDVRLCCALDDTFGNINDSSLEEIWNSKKIKRIRQSFREGKFPRMCEYCRGLDFDEYPRNSYIHS